MVYNSDIRVTAGKKFKNLQNLVFRKVLFQHTQSHESVFTSCEILEYGPMNIQEKSVKKDKTKARGNASGQFLLY